MRDMTTLYLVRHAKPAATWGEAADPGLDDIGAQQAAQTAEELGSLGGGLQLFSSPLRRCRETAAPLAAHWHAAVKLLPAVAEIPPPPLGPQERRQWLANAMSGDWSQLQASAPTGSPDYHAWRNSLLETLTTLGCDAVIFTHFIAINVVVGAAQNSERVVNFRPGHASVTEIRVSDNRFEVRRLGREAETDSGVLLGR